MSFRRRIFNIFQNKLHYMFSNTYFLQIRVVRAKFENMTFLWTPLFCGGILIVAKLFILIDKLFIYLYV